MAPRSHALNFCHIETAFHQLASLWYSRHKSRRNSKESPSTHLFWELSSAIPVPFLTPDKLWHVSQLQCNSWYAAVVCTRILSLLQQRSTWLTLPSLKAIFPHNISFTKDSVPCPGQLSQIRSNNVCPVIICSCFVFLNVTNSSLQIIRKTDFRITAC